MESRWKREGREWKEEEIENKTLIMIVNKMIKTKKKPTVRKKEKVNFQDIEIRKEWLEERERERDRRKRRKGEGISAWNQSSTTTWK